MTVRTAELVMAIATILLSIALMWKSSELAIGWIPDKGPGSGFWPFWLSTGLLLASLTTLVRWFLRATPESRSNETYISRERALRRRHLRRGDPVPAGRDPLRRHLRSLFAFLLFYLKFVGGHKWTATIALTVGIPVFIFCLFEWALTIPAAQGDFRAAVLSDLRPDVLSRPSEETR